MEGEDLRNAPDGSNIHLFWNCPPLRPLVVKHDDAIKTLCGKYPELSDIVNNHVFRGLGIVPEDTSLLRAKDALLRPQAFPIPSTSRASFSQEVLAGEVQEEGYIRAFSDGSDSHPTDKRISRGGAGVHWGSDHPWNVVVPLLGAVHNSHRAELLAFTLAVMTARLHFIAIWITLDNEAVVNLACALINNSHNVFTNDKDLWQEARQAIFPEAAPQLKVKVSWTKGHATDEHIAKGLSTPLEKERNIQADILAEQASRVHAATVRQQDLAYARTALAIICQDMYTILYDHFRTHNPKLSTNKANCGGEPSLEPALSSSSSAGLVGGASSEEQGEAGNGGTSDHFRRGSVGSFDERMLTHRRKYPSYPWGNYDLQNIGRLTSMGLENIDAVTEIRANCIITNGKNVKYGAAFDKLLWEPAVWYFNTLRWGEVKDRNLSEHFTSRQCSFAELAIDFELSTGVRLVHKDGTTATTWAQRAHQIKLLVKAIVRFCGLKAGTSYKKFFEPQGDVSTLKSFGIGTIPGVNRRPRFLSQTRTEIAICGNAKYFIDKGGSHVGQARASLNNSISYLHIPATSLWKSSAAKRFNTIVNDAAMRTVPCDHDTIDKSEGVGGPKVDKGIRSDHPLLPLPKLRLTSKVSEAALRSRLCLPGAGTAGDAELNTGSASSSSSARQTRDSPFASTCTALPAAPPQPQHGARGDPSFALPAAPPEPQNGAWGGPSSALPAAPPEPQHGARGGPSFLGGGRSRPLLLPALSAEKNVFYALPGRPGGASRVAAPCDFLAAVPSEPFGDEASGSHPSACAAQRRRDKASPLEQNTHNRSLDRGPEWDLEEVAAPPSPTMDVDRYDAHSKKDVAGGSPR